MRISHFYWNVWFEKIDYEAFKSVKTTLGSTFSSQHVLTKEEITSFCRIVDNTNHVYVESQNTSNQIAPMDIAIVLSWDCVIKCLFSKKLNVNLLNLVHLSNEIVFKSPKNPFVADDCVTSVSEICAMKNTVYGYEIHVKANLFVQNSQRCSLLTKFLIKEAKSEDDYENVVEPEMIINISSDEHAELIKSKKWMLFDQNHESFVKSGNNLYFLFV